MTEPKATTNERIAIVETKVDAMINCIENIQESQKELHSRISTTTREVTDHIDKRIDRLEIDNNEQHHEMKNSVDKLKVRIDLLERWKWMIVGGGIALGYALGHIEILSRLVK